MGAIVILICFLGSGALTVFLVELCRDDWKKRKCHVTWVENLLGTADELKLDRAVQSRLSSGNGCYARGSPHFPYAIEKKQVLEPVPAAQRTEPLDQLLSREARQGNYMATWTKISDWLTEDSQAYSAGRLPLVVAGNLQISLETRELIVEGKTLLLTEDESIS